MIIKRNFIRACVAVGLALSLPLAARAQVPLGDKEAVLAVEKLVANASTPELGLSCYDADIVQDDFFAPQRRGIKEVAKDFDVYMAHYTSFHADILDMTIDVQGDLAVAYSHQRFTAKGRAGGPDLNSVVRQTDVLRKKSGKWLITYQHISLPIDIATFKPVSGS